VQRHADVEEFKFRYVRNGDTLGFRAKQGRLGDKELTLDDDSVSYEQVVDTATRGNRIVMALSRELYIGGKLAEHLVDGSAVVLEPSGVSARVLEMAIDRRCARVAAQRRRAELVAKGQQQLLRTEECPSCGAVVDLSGLAPTLYTYCRFCESLFTRDRARVTSGEQYRICDECGLFDRIQEYPEFYFYFLLIVAGFSYKQRFLCDGCAHKLFLKTLFLNLLFVVGVPVAIWVKLKSLAGRDPTFETLARANSLARAGRYREAGVDYGVLLRGQPNHPAVLMNQALAHLVGGDQNGALGLLKRSLSACNHYAPVLRLLR